MYNIYIYNVHIYMYIYIRYIYIYVLAYIYIYGARGARLRARFRSNHQVKKHFRQLALQPGSRQLVSPSRPSALLGTPSKNDTVVGRNPA